MLTLAEIETRLRMDRESIHLLKACQPARLVAAKNS
jgi:hypothetical protein